MYSLLKNTAGILTIFLLFVLITNQNPANKDKKEIFEAVTATSSMKQIDEIKDTASTTQTTVQIKKEKQAIVITKTENAAQKQVVKPAEIAIPQIPVIQIEKPTLSFSEINEKTRSALVNIICTTLRSGLFNPVSGSGIIIDPKGVILTNAHVAEYFLLKDFLVPDFIECVIRTGEPARNNYKARLLYISPQWVQKNYKKINEENATGTGENDFALLLIAESVNPTASPLPDSYPYLQLDTSDSALIQKKEILVAGYPAGFLGGISIQKELYPVSSMAQISEIFSFGKNTADLFAINGSPLSQQGSSGGAVVSNEGKVFGIISTASSGATTGERDLHAITGSHISRSFSEINSFSIQEMLDKGDLKNSADSFAENISPQLTKLLEDAIQNNN